MGNPRSFADLLSRAQEMKQAATTRTIVVDETTRQPLPPQRSRKRREIDLHGRPEWSMSQLVEQVPDSEISRTVGREDFARRVRLECGCVTTAAAAMAPWLRLCFLS